MPEDITYKQVARYLQSQSHKLQEEGGERGAFQPSRIIPNLPWPYAEYRDYEREKEKILESLLENPAILDVLQNEKMKNREEVENWQRGSYDIRETVAGLPHRPYMSENSFPSRFGIYGNVKVLPHLSKNFFTDEKSNYPEISLNPLRSKFSQSENFPTENVENERMLKIQGKLMDFNGNEAKNEETESMKINEPQKEFTFKFDAPKFNERGTFAIRPNDPRYYEDETKIRSTSLGLNLETTSQGSINFDVSENGNLNPYAGIVETEPKLNKDYSPEMDHDLVRDKFSLMKFIMPDGGSERDPVLVSPTRMSNNDIYFIAIVAGCSAAAMFALVLIALTWCRLHRGAKAAADIEYPAYGVTGPNKDISPSGDQRLAHSAQMYHFQHQKQQIIGMENRTAASRDPGSVSEAESDEENEEGDYTVYECPGLASTGEMEVKNPMFHDDPTPATPPQIHKDEDHM